MPTTLLTYLFIVAVLLFLVNLYFEIKNQHRISKIEKTLNHAILDTIDTFKTWIDIEQNSEGFTTAGSSEKTKKRANEKKVKKNET